MFWKLEIVLRKRSFLLVCGWLGRDVFGDLDCREWSSSIVDCLVALSSPWMAFLTKVKLGYWVGLADCGK